MPLILSPKSRKMHLWEYSFSKFPAREGGGTPPNPLRYYYIACQRHAGVGLWPKYPPIIARFPPVKNLQTWLKNKVSLETRLIFTTEKVTTSTIYGLNWLIMSKYSTPALMN